MSVRMLQQPVDNLRDFLAASTAVRNFLGASTSAIAKRAIYDGTVNCESVPVISVTDGAAGTCSFTVNGDFSSLFQVGTHCRFTNSLRDLLTVTSVAYSTGVTTVGVAEAVAEPDSLPDVKPQSPPRILIWSEGIGVRKQSASRGDFQYAAGTMLVAMEWEPGVAYFDASIGLNDITGAKREFTERLDEILCFMMGRAADDYACTSFPDLSTITNEFGPDYCEPQHNDGRPAWRAEFSMLLGGA